MSKPRRLQKRATLVAAAERRAGRQTCAANAYALGNVVCTRKPRPNGYCRAHQWMAEQAAAAAALIEFMGG